MSAYDAARYAANREHERERSRASRAANPERAREYRRALYAADQERHRAYTRAYYAANRELLHKQQRDYRIANHDLRIAGNRHRRARLAQVKTNFTAADWRALSARSKRCHWCKTPFSKTRRPTHDHVIPISKGGGNTLENSVCACLACNTSKNARLVNPVTGQGILL